jgi:hypothetical protein
MSKCETKHQVSVRQSDRVNVRQSDRVSVRQSDRVSEREGGAYLGSGEANDIFQDLDHCGTREKLDYRDYGVKDYGVKDYGVKDYGVKDYGMKDYGMKDYGMGECEVGVNRRVHTRDSRRVIDRDTIIIVIILLFQVNRNGRRSLGHR